MGGMMNRFRGGFGGGMPQRPPQQFGGFGSRFGGFGGGMPQRPPRQLMERMGGMPQRPPQQVA